MKSFANRSKSERLTVCRLPQAAASFFPFHIEHIRARQHKGTDDPSNLALACPDCNAFKGPNLTCMDPDSDQVVPLFNPRADSWSEHFALRGPRIIGLTPIGRGTVHLLNMNEEGRVEMRAELLARGELRFAFDEQLRAILFSKIFLSRLQVANTMVVS